MVHRIVLAAAFAAAFTTAARAEDCKDCQPKKECKPHEEADDAAIKEAQAKFKERDLMVRREGLDIIVTAASKHPNCRSRKLTGELMRLLADPEPSVRTYAADRLGEFGEEAMAVQALDKEAKVAEKKIPVQKPDKEPDLKQFEADLRILDAIYLGLGKTKSPLAAAVFDRGLHHASSWVIEVAARNCKPLKGNKLIMKGLIEQLAKFYSASVNPGNSAAWTAISMSLPEVTGCNDIPTQKDGGDAGRWCSDWQKWWRENEKKLK
ncbi:MAG: hypothetical protein HYY18_21340 [Planctomycetes bacterium]|nr:hypothetical protein [Planctomycetota bacterium]